MLQGHISIHHKMCKECTQNVLVSSCLDLQWLIRLLACECMRMCYELECVTGGTWENLQCGDPVNYVGPVKACRPFLHLAICLHSWLQCVTSHNYYVHTLTPWLHSIMYLINECAQALIDAILQSGSSEWKGYIHTTAKINDLYLNSIDTTSIDVMVNWYAKAQVCGRGLWVSSSSCVADTPKVTFHRQVSNTGHSRIWPSNSQFLYDDQSSLDDKDNDMSRSSGYVSFLPAVVLLCVYLLLQNNNDTAQCWG
jgi:hypothetical protein